MNPFTLLDSFLNDYAPPAVRRVVHAVLTLAASLAAIWFAADGDWAKVVPLVLTALYAETNKANTDTTPLKSAFDAPEPDDGLTYEEAGGNEFPEGDQPQSEPVSGNP